jgi:hypothetical protein
LEEIDMNAIIINHQEFRQLRCNRNYWISSDGKVYSEFAKKIIKTPINHTRGKDYARVDIWIDGKQRHMMVHRLVYDTWKEPIQSNDQINHKNDNSLDNRIENLYKGTQKQNISDCIKTEHRVNHMKYLTVYDNKYKKTMTFAPASDFITFSGHPCNNNSVKRMFSRKWFKKRYRIIEFGCIQNLLHYKSVTTMADECKPVDRTLSPVQAHGQHS